MGFYDEQRKVNIFLRDKIKALHTGEFKQLDVNRLMLELTTEHAISKKYILTRINDMLKEYTQIVLKDGVLYKND